MADEQTEVVQGASWKYVRLERLLSSPEICVLRVDRPPVNALGSPLLSDLNRALTFAEKAPDIRAIVIAAVPSARGVFSAGLDLQELAAARSEDDLRQMAHLLSDWYARLLVTPLVTVAAIRGFCAAGGCMMAMCCDVRVMTEGSRMGLNELQLGMRVPVSWAVLMARLVGDAAADRLCLGAALADDATCLRVGLVQEVCGPDAVLRRAVAAARPMLAHPDAPRAGYKKERLSQLALDVAAEGLRIAQDASSFFLDPRNADRIKQILGRGAKAPKQSKL
ncbi:unnamed protein product [Pedinophyceae sp. YPF-701]|nr:unnamed protein product [Pedinophyceae sp. YPF-701]